MKTLVTGADGFIGRKMLETLAARGIASKAVIRNSSRRKAVEPFTGEVFTGGIEACIDSVDCWRDVSSIVHLAARVHKMKDVAEDPLAEYKKANTDLTLKLAETAMAHKVKKLIFISSVKVIAGEGGSGHDENDLLDTEKLKPEEFYGASKLFAERGLAKLYSRQKDCNCVIFRLPMVYGPGNRGNIFRLLDLAAGGTSLPLAGARGRRSMIYVSNLCDAIVKVITDTTKNRQILGTYFINDGKDFTSGELYSMIYGSMSGGKGIYYLPEELLRVAGSAGSFLERVTSRQMPLNSQMVLKLFNSYSFSMEQFRRDYNWEPPYTPKEGIEATVEWYNSEKRG